MRRSRRRWSLRSRLTLAALCCEVPGIAGLLLAASLWRTGELTSVSVLTSASLLAGALLLIVLVALPGSMWAIRRLRERLGALDTAARHLTVAAERAGGAGASTTRDARALEAEASQLRAALAQSPAAVQEMTDWARWLLPRWESLTARRRSDGALHLAQQMQQLRDTLNEQARASERIVAIVSRFNATVEPARQLRQSMLTRAQDLCAATGSLARGFGPALPSPSKGNLSPRVTRGMLSRRVLAALAAASLLPLGAASVALCLWLGNWNLFGRWPFMAGVGGTLFLTLLIGALIARSMVRPLATVAAELAAAGEAFADAANGQATAPELARATGTLESTARAVRRGAAVAGGALEWPLRMGQPLFDATAFDAEAGRHVLEVATSALGQVQQTVAALEEQGAQLVAAAAAVSAYARAASRDVARSTALATEVEAASGRMRAAVAGGRTPQPYETGAAQLASPATAPQPVRTRWRPPVGAWARHTMPRIPTGRPSGGPTRSAHDTPFDLEPKPARYRPMEPDGERAGRAPLPPSTQPASENERERPSR